MLTETGYATRLKVVVIGYDLTEVSLAMQRLNG